MTRYELRYGFDDYGTETTMGVFDTVNDYTVCQMTWALVKRGTHDAIAAELGRICNLLNADEKAGA